MPEIQKRSRVRITVEVVDANDQRVGYPAVYRMFEVEAGTVRGTRIGREVAYLIQSIEEHPERYRDHAPLPKEGE